MYKIYMLAGHNNTHQEVSMHSVWFYRWMNKNGLLTRKKMATSIVYYLCTDCPGSEYYHFTAVFVVFAADTTAAGLWIRCTVVCSTWLYVVYFEVVVRTLWLFRLLELDIGYFGLVEKDVLKACANWGKRYFGVQWKPSYHMWVMSFAFLFGKKSCLLLCFFQAHVLLACLLGDGFGLGFLNGQEEFELGRQFVLGIETVGEVHSPYPAVGMNLNPQRFYVVCPVGTTCEIGQVELNLIPSLIQSHGHGANEWLYPRSRLVIAGPKATSYVFIVQDLAGRKSEKQKMKTRKRSYD